MFAEEWPLMMFTLISQLAIGSFIMLAVIRFSLNKHDATMAAKLTNPGFKAVGVIMSLALLLSVLHLGAPMGAYRSVLNLRFSWLSREIMTAGGFLFFWFLSYRAYQKETAGNGLAWVTSLLGLFVVLSMSNIYSHSIRPAWTNANTYIAFFSATFTLGSLGAAAFIVYGAKGAELTSAVIDQLKKMSLIAGAAIILPLLYLPIYISSLANGNAAAQQSVQLLTGSYQFLLTLKGVLSLAGAGIISYAIWRAGNDTQQRWVYLAFILVMIGEFLGRFVFYGSAVSMTIGLN